MFTAQCNILPMMYPTYLKAVCTTIATEWKFSIVNGDIFRRFWEAVLQSKMIHICVSVGLRYFYTVHVCVHWHCMRCTVIDFNYLLQIVNHILFRHNMGVMGHVYY